MTSEKRSGIRSESNNFLFDNKMFRQISGTAMGTKFAPPYACLTMGYLEETMLFPITLKEIL